MNTKCNRSNYNYDYVFDLNDNILQRYDFKPMYYTNNVNHVQPYNEQAQGIMPYKSSNTISQLLLTCLTTILIFILTYFGFKYIYQKISR